MNRRVFIGLPLPSELKTEILEYFQKWQFEEAKPVASENWHVTLQFIGELDENRLEKLLEILEQLMEQTKALELEAEQINFFPNSRLPRMIWAFLKPSAGFRELVEEIRVACDKSGINLEDKKESIPHITLARLRGNLAIKNFKVLKLLTGRQSFNQVIVYQSKFTGQGANYSVIREYKLK